MKQILTLASLLLLSFIPFSDKGVTLSLDDCNALQTIAQHTINILDNGNSRNNYDSIKWVIQEQSIIIQFIEAKKKDSTNGR